MKRIDWAFEIFDTALYQNQVITIEDKGIDINDVKHYLIKTEDQRYLLVEETALERIDK